MRNLVKDTSNITQINIDDILKLTKISEDLICDYVFQSKMMKNNRTDFDIGFGVISILVDTDDIKYRFTPNTSLEDNIKTTLKKNKSPLKIKAEKALSKRLKLCYKELL